MQNPPFKVPALPAADTVVDTIRVIDQQVYIDLLEKTNQQMSYWWGPLGAAIALLGLLFAAGAIVAGYLLYRQSRDYREQLTSVLATSQAQHSAAIAQYEVVISDLIATTNQQIETAITSLQERTETATEEQKTVLEQEIKALRNSLIRPPPARTPSPAPAETTSEISARNYARRIRTRDEGARSARLAEVLGDFSMNPCPACGRVSTLAEWWRGDGVCACGKHLGASIRQSDRSESG